MKVLAINTYAGSLLLGAQAANFEIVGSYEDAGFGQAIAQANFPHLEHVRCRADWPTRDLRDTFVIAHPPCSAFSIQNSSRAARGTGSKAFQCTKEVLQYAMSNGAMGIAVESVVGAMTGAWATHQHYADAHGYYLYRILQNGSMFGAQWRERFWVLYLKKERVKRSTVELVLYPRWASVADVVTGYEDGPSPGNLDARFDEQRQRFWKEVPGYDKKVDEYLFSGRIVHRGGIAKVFHARLFPDEIFEDTMIEYIGTFTSQQMCYVDPSWLSPVILGSSWFYMNGRNLSERAFKVLMGFPPDYVFPEGRSRREMRAYLSKGVMPPIARWILCEAAHHLGQDERKDEPYDDHPPYRVSIEPGEIADFRYRKTQWGQPRPKLRHEDNV